MLYGSGNLVGHFDHFTWTKIYYFINNLLTFISTDLMDLNPSINDLLIFICAGLLESEKPVKQQG